MIASPPSAFDIALIARTLYAALGSSNWRVYVYPSRFSLASLAIEARLPLELVKERILGVNEPKIPVEQQIIIVDPHGMPVWNYQDQPRLILIDHKGMIEKKLCGEVYRLRGLGLQNKTYEAISIIYELIIRRLNNKRIVVKMVKQSLDPHEVHLALYLARKILEAKTYLGSIILLDPNTLAYALRSILRKYGYLIDIKETEIKIEHVEGKLIEKISFEVYDIKKLRRIGKLGVTFNTNSGEIAIDLPWEKILKLYMMGEKICIDEGTCIGPVKEHMELGGISKLFDTQYT